MSVSTPQKEFETGIRSICKNKKENQNHILAIDRLVHVYPKLCKNNEWFVCWNHRKSNVLNVLLYVNFISIYHIGRIKYALN